MTCDALVFPWWRRGLHDNVVCMCTVVVWLLLCSGAAEKRHTHLYPSLQLPLYLKKSSPFVQETNITWHLGGWVRLNELISLVPCYNKCPELMYTFRITAMVYERQQEYSRNVYGCATITNIILQPQLFISTTLVISCNKSNDGVVQPMA